MNQAGRKHIDLTSSPLREQLASAPGGLEPDTVCLHLPSPFFTPFTVTPVIFLSVLAIRTDFARDFNKLVYRVEAIDRTPLGFTMALTLRRDPPWIQSMEISWLAVQA